MCLTVTKITKLFSGRSWTNPKSFEWKSWGICSVQAIQWNWEQVELQSKWSWHSQGRCQESHWVRDKTCFWEIAQVKSASLLWHTQIVVAKHPWHQVHFGGIYALLSSRDCSVVPSRLDLLFPLLIFKTNFLFPLSANLWKLFLNNHRWRILRCLHQVQANSNSFKMEELLYPSEAAC